MPLNITLQLVVNVWNSLLSFGVKASVLAYVGLQVKFCDTDTWSEMACHEDGFNFYGFITICSPTLSTFESRLQKHDFFLIW